MNPERALESIPIGWRETVVPHPTGPLFFPGEHDRQVQNRADYEDKAGNDDADPCDECHARTIRSLGRDVIGPF